MAEGTRLHAMDFLQYQQYYPQYAGYDPYNQMYQQYYPYQQQVASPFHHVQGQYYPQVQFQAEVQTQVQLQAQPQIQTLRELFSTLDKKVDLLQLIVEKFAARTIAAPLTTPPPPATEQTDDHFVEVEEEETETPTVKTSSKISNGVAMPMDTHKLGCISAGHSCAKIAKEMEILDEGRVKASLVNPMETIDGALNMDVKAAAVAIPLTIHYVHQLFVQCPEQDLFRWNTMLRGSTQSSNPMHAISLHLRVRVRSWIKLFDQMPSRNIAIWNMKIKRCVNNGCVVIALGFFRKMHLMSVRHDNYSLASVLSVCCFELLDYVLLNKLQSGNGFSQEVFESFMFNYDEVESATQYFFELNLSGKSSFSTIYKGMLRDGSVVDVTCISKISCKFDEAEFLKGLKLLTSLKHENLLKLRGFCCSKSKGECFLVYDFVSNGNLLQNIDVKDGKGKIIQWPVRVSIIEGIAKGIEYLHGRKGNKPALVYQNISAEKVLIDQHHKPLLSNSGLHKLLADDIAGAELGRFEDFIDKNLHGTSATKYIVGHNNVLADCISGPEKLVSIVRNLDNILGGVLNSNVAYLIIQGLKSCYCYTIVLKEESMVESRFRHDKFAVNSCLEVPWVDEAEVLEAYSGLNLEDKVFSKGGGNVMITSRETKLTHKPTKQARHSRRIKSKPQYVSDYLSMEIKELVITEKESTTKELRDVAHD